MSKKIPTQAEIRAKRAAINKMKEEENRKQLMSMMYDKSLKMIFHSALALEAHDHLVPTLNYKREFKRDGNRFLAHLEKTTEKNFHEVYKEHPEFTQNMMEMFEGVIDKACEILATVEFGEWAVLNKVLEEFQEDKENYKDNLQLQFNRLDTDMPKENTQEENPNDVITTNKPI